MKLHKLVRGMIGIVNLTITGTLYRSKGYVLNGVKQEPVYEDPESIELQVQSLRENELKHSYYVSM